ncbi:hypothetical protein L0Y65_04105 [Candidatus Micrarchaeota archaeon]|nr:hypothetical protein [Candidatus Micrarchaeota archaeon]
MAGYTKVEFRYFLATAFSILITYAAVQTNFPAQLQVFLLLWALTAFFGLYKIVAGGIRTYSVMPDSIGIWNRITGQREKIAHPDISEAVCACGVYGFKTPFSFNRIEIFAKGRKTSLEFDNEPEMASFASELAGHIGKERIFVRSRAEMGMDAMKAFAEKKARQ